jgi:hypothetical protein
MEIRFFGKPKGEIAVVGSPGLRSVGLIAANHLIKEWHLKKFAQMYSSSFPVTYHGIPYYGTTGEGGSKVEEGMAELPKIDFYTKDNFIVVRGYHADLLGQYKVASKVVDLIKEIKIKYIIALGGYVSQSPSKERKVCYCATYPEIIKSKKMERLGIGKKEAGPFLGFTALVLGIGHLKGIKGIALFGETTLDSENPLKPDKLAAKALLKKLSSFLRKEIDISRLGESINLGYI